MQYRVLGQTDLKVSLICLGTMTWGRQNTQNEGHEQMDYALDQGVNFWDTAEMYAVPPNAETYGKTEDIIGTWFAKTKKRDQVILASKIAGVGLPWVRDGQNKIDRKNILLAVEGSLKRLQTDYIDLYQLHWPNRGGIGFQQNWNYAPNFDRAQVVDNITEVLETLDEFVKCGKIRHIGLSNETAWGVMQYLSIAEKRGLPRIASIQNEYSLLNRHFDTDLHEVAKAESVGLLAWSPLATGMLSGKYIGGKRPKGTRWTLTASTPRDTQNAQDAVAAYIKVAKKHGLDVCQMALAFVNQRPFITSTIIGATSMAQLKSNIASVNITLSPEVLRDILIVHKHFPMPY